MAKVNAFKDNSVIISCSKMLIYNLETADREERDIEANIPTPSEIKKIKEGNDTDDESSTTEVIATDISSCGNLMALCTTSKNLHLWNTQCWTLISHRQSARIASSVRFTPSREAIILADRAGDAYSFSVRSPQEEGKLLLGHTSMLLDILLTPDEKYIITCDRDEKIRVSQYPNTYIIHTYCLGHDEFVKGLHLLPHDSAVLISYSGDGSIRFWNYEEGKELHVVNASGDVSINKIKFCDSATNDANELSESEQSLAVRLLSGCIYDSGVSLIAACVSKVACCLIYRAVGDTKSIQVSLIQVLRFQVEPWDILLQSQKLYYLSPTSGGYVKLYALDDSTSQFIEEKDEKYLRAVEFFNRDSKFFEKLQPPGLLQTLYKRKFDDLHEYQEKKRQRLRNSSKAKKLQKRSEGTRNSSDLSAA